MSLCTPPSTRRRRPVRLVATSLILAAAAHLHATSRVIPFQGRLTDPSGKPIADGARIVQFKIYDAPVGGRAAWNGEVHNLTVNAGLVSTLLGTRSALTGVDFNQDLYLEITIDANGDSQITLADPPLLPRQSILPAVFAAESADSRLLRGHDWTALFGTNNPATGTLLDSKIADNSITGSKLREATIPAAKLADGSVTPRKIDATGASSGQSLRFNGTEVVWSRLDAVNADRAAVASNAELLGGFAWSSVFNGGNPATGEMIPASVSCRGRLLVSGNALFNGTSTTVQGSLIAPSLGINTFLNDWGLYFRSVGDFNHSLKWGNSLGNQSGIDGPLLVGLGGGVLGTPSNWSLRWNANGTVQTRGALSQGSDRASKENFAPVNPADILDRVVRLPITEWNYKDDPSSRHLGPVAQDFRASFGLGADDTSITTVDADGVALAAIQALHAKVERADSQLRTLLEEQRRQIDALVSELKALKSRPSAP